MKGSWFAIAFVVFVLGLFALDVVYVTHEQRQNAERVADSVVPMDVFNVTYEYNGSVRNSSLDYEDCYVALGYFDGVEINGTTTFRNCGVTNEKVFCYGKNGKIKCEVRR